MKKLVLGQMPDGAAPETHLAAGPWCFCGVEQKFPHWESLFTFAPEPLAAPGALPAAARAAQTLCIKLIPQVAALLDSKKAELPPAYWQVLLSPWLMDLSSQLVDRALRARAMLAKWAVEAIEVDLLPADCQFSFRDEQDFTLRGALGLQFNHWLFSRLLEPALPSDWTVNRLNAISETPARARPGFGACLRGAVHKLSHRLAFPRLKNMSLATALKLSSALRHTCAGPDHSLDIDGVFDFSADLAQIALPEDLLPIIRPCIPESLIALAHSPCTKNAASPRLRVAGPESYENAAYRQQLAIWRSQGDRLAYIQHGANYGAVETPCTAAVVEYSQDIFFTWGWQTQGCARSNFVPMPALQLLPEAEWKLGQGLVFVGTEMSAYGRRLDSHPTPLQYVAYRKDKAEFFAELGQNLQENSIYRPYFPLPGVLEDAAWLLPQFPALRLCEGPLLPHLLNCRLLVLDHPGTTFLEAMAYNIPVVAYWNRSYWPFVPEAAILLDALEQAGIWYASPQAAARQVNRIWNKAQEWRDSSPVAFARKLFCEHQALRSPDAIAEWAKLLKTL